MIGFVARFLGRRRIKFGVNEFMAQTMRLSWPEFDSSYVEDIVLRPVFPEISQASTLVAPFESSLEPLASKT